MTQSRLIELSYYDPSAQVRLSAYADTVVLDHNSKGGIISAVRFGGYSEMVRAMSDAIYGGATIEATQNSTTRMLQSNVKGYQRQMSHDGVYAVATLMASDDAQTDDRASEGDGEVEGQEAMQPRKCYIFCPQGDRDRLFEELDHKTAAPLIPAFRDYVLDALQKRGDLRQLEVISLKEKMDAWVLDLKPEDRNVVEVLETGLKNGSIQIPGAIPGAPDGFDGVENVTGYLNTFGVTVADRIRHQFMPLFDPANEPLSDEVLAINDCIMNRAGYSLYDAQLAVAEAVKRQLDRKSVALIIAECGAGKTKIGSTALGALHGLWAAQKRSGAGKSFGIIMCPSHVTRKWVREIGETLPDTYAMVVHSIAELDRLYAMYEQGDKSVYAVFSKERARDGYMRYPAVKWSKRLRAFLCPDCNEVVTMEISEDGSRYTVPADQFFFQNEHRKNHVCPNCGSVLWSAVNPGKRIEWVKIGEYGWVHRYSYKVDAKDGSIMEAYHFILLADAKKIALDDAGVSEKVTFTEETLVAGGIKSPYYYFAFESASARWTYKIDAVLGVIMDKTYDKIIPPAPEFIGLEKAKQIALEDAGLDEAAQKIVFTKEELSRNSGKPCYILEFYTDKCAYSYKVDAVSGDIIGKKTEWFSRQESETVPDTSQNSDSKQRRGN